jgi:hypothetical protein
MRREAFDVVRETGLEVRRPVMLSNDSEKDSLGKGIGGKSCGVTANAEEVGTFSSSSA